MMKRRIHNFMRRMNKQRARWFAWITYGALVIWLAISIMGEML